MSDAPTGMMDLTEGKVVPVLVRFALPTLGSNILMSLNGSISAVYVGKLLGVEGLAATSVANMVSFLVFATIFGFSMAATILIGQSVGRRDIDEVRRTIGAASGGFILMGILFAVGGIAAIPYVLRILATPEAVQPLAQGYLEVLFLAFPILFLSLLLQSALRGVGDAITPLWTTILNLVLCLVLNPLLILGIGPFPELGLRGAALAGQISNFLCLVFLLFQIYRKDLPIRLRGEEFRLLIPDMKHLRPILAIGLPMGLSMIIMSTSGLVMMGLINREGVDTVAAYGAVNQLWSYIQMPAVAVSSAVSAMAAQNIGAGRWDRIDRIAWAGIGINIAMTIALVLPMNLFADQLLHLFLPANSPAIAIGVHVQWVVGWTFILMGVGFVVTAVVRANGAVLVPLLILIFASVLVRFSVGFSLYDRFGADAIWWSFIATAVVSTCLSITYFRRGSWRKRKAAPAPEVIEPVGL